MFFCRCIKRFVWFLCIGILIDGIGDIIWCNFVFFCFMFVKVGINNRNCYRMRNYSICI